MNAEENELPEDENNLGEANVRRTLRRGNINFEFLNPREIAAARAREEAGRERRRGQRDDKRGLFNRGRPPSPITSLSLVFWGALSLMSLAGLAGIFFYAESVVWLLGLPFLAGAFFWSLVMLSLFAARPR